MTREIWIVGDFTLSKPFMLVEYFRNHETKYAGHKILSTHATKKEAEEALTTIN